jgi:hypothetical protein
MLTSPNKDNPYSYNLMYIYIGLGMGGYTHIVQPLALLKWDP